MACGFADLISYDFFFLLKNRNINELRNKPIILGYENMDGKNRVVLLLCPRDRRVNVACNLE